MTQSSADATMLARGASFDQIGSELLRALDACRPQCLSLHDATGDVLWLNAGVIGPDEHGYVLDALDELALEPERTHMQRRLADNRRALFMGARNPAGACCGVVFVILDCPGGPEEDQPMPQPLAALMRRLSMLLAPQAAKNAAPTPACAAAARTASAQAADIEVTELELEPDPAPAKPAAVPAAPAARAAAAVVARTLPAAVEVTELELDPIEPPAKQSTPKSESRPKVARKAEAVSEANAVTMIAPIPALAPAAALASAAVLSQVTGETLPIRARKFVRLQGRGTNRRYEVTILSPGEGQDVRILKAVSAWLSHHLDQYTEEHASFAVPVTAAAALDGRFVAALGGVLTHRPLPEGMLGLLLPSAAWRHPGTAPLLAQCERLRCPVTLDDFSLRHDGFQILRSKAIRMVKLDPQLTSSAMNDRFARAALAAITQSARVLGFHCIAKGDISSSGARWLAAAGVDYADPSTASAAGAQAPKSAARQALEQAS
jgi:EAL domain-containing protein (putative c-di-GMP-specific phosphodiesterase class I)